MSPANSLAVILASTSVSKSLTAVCDIDILTSAASVICPFWFTVKVPTALELP